MPIYYFFCNSLFSSFDVVLKLWTEKKNKKYHPQLIWHLIITRQWGYLYIWETAMGAWYETLRNSCVNLSRRRSFSLDTNLSFTFLEKLHKVRKLLDMPPCLSLNIMSSQCSLSNDLDRSRKMTTKTFIKWFSSNV